MNEKRILYTWNLHWRVDIFTYCTEVVEKFSLRDSFSEIGDSTFGKLHMESIGPEG